jgi:arylsulfatase A-like enzyme
MTRQRQARRARTLAKRSALAVTLALAVGGGLAVSWQRTVGRPSAPTGVVIITLDTTRADRLSPYGLMDVSMPALERLAREGVVFDQAMSVAPLTLPAHASLFTGLIPPNHGVRDNADEALATAETTLAELLQARGFKTAAFIGSTVLDPDRGLAQGFDTYRGMDSKDRRTPATRQRRADEVIGDATRWLDEVGDSPFFVWTHLYDPHRPYDPPEPFRSRLADAYVGEIAFADSQIGRLLDAMDERHLLERTIVIVVGDHGESLGEHGERDHGIFLYDSVLRVPLLVRAPGLAPRRVSALVRLTDVMPTVLDLLDMPEPSMDGVSLVELLNGRRQSLDLVAYAESLYPERRGWSPLRALSDGRFKLIDAPRPELYDLERDPFEQQNIYDDRRTMAEAIGRRLQVLARGRAARTAPSTLASATPELRERLGALGYVGSTVARASPSPANLPDPKDCIGYSNARHGLAPSSVAPTAARRCD